MEFTPTVQFDKPSRLSIFWWRNYFSDDPNSIFKEKGVFYDREGNLRYPADRNPPVAYWNNNSWFWLYYWNCNYPGSYWGYAGGNQVDGDGIFLILAVIFAFVAVIMAVMVVLTWPPAMIISWVVLVVGSFSEVLVGKEASCVNFRIYNAVSASTVLLYLLHITLGVYQLQNHYNGYFPGTPGIKINAYHLLSYFQRNKSIYAWICFPNILLMVGGILVGSCVNATVCASFSSCYWTSVTLYAWVVVHFLNSVASYSMYLRMNEKYKKLKDPPAYERTMEPLYTEQPVPVYQAS